MLGMPLQDVHRQGPTATLVVLSYAVNAIMAKLLGVSRNREEVCRGSAKVRCVRAGVECFSQPLDFSAERSRHLISCRLPVEKVEGYVGREVEGSLDERPLLRDFANEESVSLYVRQVFKLRGHDKEPPEDAA